jgi:hypothetical protein
VNSLDDYLYDINNRPSNGELRFFIGLQTVIYGAAGGAIPLFTLHWLGVRRWPLVGIALLGAAVSVWLLLRYFKRRGVETKANYVAHGGNPAGTSDLLFGQMVYEIAPDGRWKWPTPSSGE